MNENQVFRWIAIVILVFLLLLAAFSVVIVSLVRQSTESILSPVAEANGFMNTQIAKLVNPTPTILPDPVTIIHEMRSLARLETIQYSMEKVITAEIGQGDLGFLFGDRLLLVAHGNVIAGVDLQKLQANDLSMESNVLHVRLPPAEIFVATLDNDLSYVYDRETGILTRGDIQLETKARQAAEQEILTAALDEKILETAQGNAENFLAGFLRTLGYPEVIFVRDHLTPQP